MHFIKYCGLLAAMIVAQVACKSDKTDSIPPAAVEPDSAESNTTADGEVDGPNLSSASARTPAATPAPVAAGSDKSDRWQGSGVSWAVPKGWTQAPGTNMRFATLTPDGADGPEIAVSVFPGNVGGTLANVNRWRGQMGLSPIGQDDVAASLKSVPVGAIEGHLVDLSTPAGDRRMLTVILPQAGADNKLVRTWFFKLSADPASVSKHEADFMSLVQSVEF